MIDHLISLFKEAQQETNDATPSANLAAAALLVEIMAADHTLDKAEIKTIERVLYDQFFLTEEAVRTLLEEAQYAVDNTSDLFKFTTVINDQFGPEEKINLLDALWKVAYSDAHLDKYEEHMIRRITGLLHISHSEFIKSKHRAQSE